MSHELVSQAAAPPSDRRDVFQRLIAVAAAAGRADLAQQLREEWSRVDRIATTVVLAGETKRGKSSLLNALVARPVSLVGEDVTTSAHVVVRWGSAPAARVVRTETGAMETVPLEPPPPRTPTTGSSEREQGVRVAEVVLDLPLLATGLVLVDTPGVGGLGAAHVEVTLAALARADCLLFVADAEAPLGSPELAFLRRAGQVVGRVIVALTKIDAYHGWRDVLAHDRELLEAAGFGEAQVVPVSSALTQQARAAARQGREEQAGELAAASGIEALRNGLIDLVRARADAARGARLGSAAGSALRALRDADAAVLAPTNTGEVEQLREAHRRTQQFLRASRVADLVLVDELMRIQEDVEFTLNRSLGAIRRKYEAVLGSTTYRTKIEAEAGLKQLEHDLNQEFVALFASLTHELVREFQDLRSRLEEELGVDFKPWAGQPGFRPPEAIASDAAPGPESIPPPARVVEVGGYASTFYWWAIAGPIGGVLGALVGGGLSIGRWRQVGRMHTYQQGKLLLANALEEARTQVVPLLRKHFRGLRRGFEEVLVESVTERDRQLGALLEEAARLEQSPDVRQLRELALGRRAELAVLQDAVDRLRTQPPA